MRQRSKTGQKRHDDGVRRTAEWYKGKGFRVKADLPGEPKPAAISGFIPDVIAKKGNKEIIIEVETRKTSVTDKEQQKAFREYASKKKERTFRKKVI